MKSILSLSKLQLLVFLFLFSLFLLFPFSYTALSEHSPITSNDSTIKVNVIFAGDAMVHSTQYHSAFIHDSDYFDFSPVFQYIKPILASSDINIVNLETTLGGKPYSGYPNFSSPDTFAYALKDAGFNYVALANNHTLDKGKNGLLRTNEVLMNYNFTSLGTYRDSADRADRYPLIIEINSIKLALLNYTYGTNGIPTPEPVIVNLIDTALIRKDIAKARSQGADFVLVYFHWGTEYSRHPNETQREIATFTFQAGADIIIGSHPHVVQPIELQNADTNDISDKRWVVWSLGNFISNQRDKHTDGGIMIKFTIEKNIYSNKTFVSHMTYIPYWVYRPLNPTNYYIVPVALLEHNDKLFPDMTSADRDAFTFFSNETRLLLKNDSLPLQEGIIPLIN
ncbi:MAG: CapA family protein [Bacteroidales bacterium]|nr:CapA family protein [Bacteroidales bacterium]